MSVSIVASLIRSPLANTISRLPRTNIDPIAAVIFGLWSTQSKIIDEKRMYVYEVYIRIHYEHR